MDGVRGRFVAEWAPGLTGAQNGDPELGKFEPHHFHTLYTHIKTNYAKIQFQQNNRTGLHLYSHY